MQKIILFNAPANSGKDVAVNYLHKQYGVFPFSFKKKLIEIVKCVYSLTDEEVALYSSREEKEKPQSRLCGRSWRQALIHVSEDVIKPKFGKDYFGKAALEYIKQNNKSEIIACSDCGFVPEITPLVNAVGGENILLVYLEAEGCSFDGDSRDYVYHNAIPDGNYIKIFNHKDEAFFDDLDWLYAFISKSL